VTWDALPSDTEEFELLLKIERPAPLKIRLTESQDPALGSLSWQIPDLPCTGARLVLRRGAHGRETTWAASERFSIVPSGLGERRAAAVRMAFRDDELWLETAPLPARPVCLEPGHRLAPEGPLQSLPAGALTRTEEFAVRPCTETARGVTCRAAAPAPPGGRCVARVPARLQLRI